MMGARILAAVTVVTIGAAAALAFVTIHPPPLKVKSRAARSMTPVTPIVLPDVEAPPLPTARDWAPQPPSPAEPVAPGIAASSDLANRPIEALRASANANDPAAMEELGRRLIQGIGVAKDQQAGAGWLLRAAEQGSAQSAFNVGVMYERGFVVERDSTKAAQWYRKAADGGVPMAKHNLALLLRDGKGVPRDGKAAIELLQSAARQGMAASMFSLGDIYDRGDVVPRDATAALAWFAITGEFERQANPGEDTALARTASQRASVLQRTLTPDELKQAQEIAQAEFKRIVEALAPPKPVAEPTEPPSGPAATTSQAAAPSPAAPDTPMVWPASALDQVRAVQQALFELGLLRDKPDGGLGPMTRAAIRTFQKSSGLRETGEPSKDLYVSLRLSLARRDVVANSPLPAPPKETPQETPKPALAPAAPVQQQRELPKADLPRQEPTKKEPVKQEPVKQEPPKQEAAKPEPVRIELARAEPPPPPNAAEFTRSTSKPAAVPAAVNPPKPTVPAVDIAKPQPVNVDTAPPTSRIDLGRPEPPPPPPTSSDIQRLTERTSPDAWPSNGADQIKALQRLLREMKVYAGPVDGRLGAETRAAIREYERLAGVRQTGEPSQTLFESLKEMRALMAR